MVGRPTGLLNCSIYLHKRPAGYEHSDLLCTYTASVLFLLVWYPRNR